tara:strand:- start:304 stop:516 length:213 start_codon:yes stop_codon:yes gene_type:complete
MAYHAVEKQHKVEHLNPDPDLEPIEPKIHISVTEMQHGDIGIEWDVRECESFVEDHGKWIRLCPGKAIPR